MKPRVTKRRVKAWKPSRADLAMYDKIRRHFGLPCYELMILGEVVCKLGCLGPEQDHRMVLVATSVKINRKDTALFLKDSAKNMRTMLKVKFAEARKADRARNKE